jgi:hypothetical protein
MNFFIFAIFCSIAALAFAQDTFPSGAQLDSGESKFSLNQQWRLILQTDGNLVIYNTATGVYKWATQTIGSGAIKAIMQEDGQFCLYNAAGELKWTTYTRDAGSVARLESDGILAVHSPKGYAVWNSVTGWGKKTTV